MPRVTRDGQAVADLDAIYHYISVENHSPAAADRFLDAVQRKFDLYAGQPELGQLRPDLGERIRIFSSGNYIVIYRPIDDGIDVLRVIEGHRDYPAILHGFH